MKTCRLCLKERELKNSHIIPEFFYQPLYDEKHRFHVLSTKRERPRPMEQAGARERLLCIDCETKLSRWETYAANVFANIVITNQDTKPFITVDRIDYRKFKLFELSILWRVSVASHSLFRKVDLGSHEEKMRYSLHEENAPQADYYGSIKFALMGNGGARLLNSFIYQAEYRCIGGHRAVRLIFGGYMWLFFMNSCPIQRHLSREFLQTDGSLHIWKSRASDLQDVKRFVTDIKTMGRGPKK